MALMHENLTGQIIKAFYKAYNELGYGFLEKDSPSLQSRPNF